MLSIVPVLDLRDGVVVHARQGDRARYRPIRSLLAPGSEPAGILDGLLRLAPFTHCYIADLDAIERRGSHRALVAELVERYPGMELWIDSGIATAAAAAEVATERVVPVLGSESLATACELAIARDRLGPARCILSLDYRGDAFLGPAGIETQPELWPDRVLAMTLSRVGGAAGPDFERLRTVQQRIGHRRLFAAGGVRHLADLAALAAMGIAGALVASALHDGRLDRAAVSSFISAR